MILLTNLHAHTPRRELTARIAHLEGQRDRALAKSRATHEHVMAALERAADSHDLDADHLGGKDALARNKLDAAGHRAVANRLRDLVRDVHEGDRLG